MGRHRTNADVAALWGGAQFVDWETQLTRAFGETLLGVSFGALILAMGVISTIPAIRPLVFILYFGVVSFSAALGGRLLQAFTTTILVAAHTLIPLAIEHARSRRTPSSWRWRPWFWWPW